ncbi:MAG: AAA family ATPase, partial [Oscillospiraceae bacterium]|nr:AAA family ATPase [Oscillospiraceae bacterium]
MKIYSMTATFGKLQHEILTLQPGLNVIHAPNEWGKSTWCAFLVAMLYGLDTRAKSTKMALADKERYAPWSGSPMAGRIDLNWNGRDITIERQTKRRVPLGEFRAYETETGLEIQELTAANCGQLLLGVERSVF